ncbi:hypothetical protein Hanom_Chr15g01386841 [Helianthus anomalus]
MMSSSNLHKSAKYPKSSLTFSPANVDPPISCQSKPRFKLQ